MSELIKKWNKAKANLTEATKIENELRLQVAKEFWPTWENGDVSGTKNQELSENLTLKGKFSINYTVDKDNAKIEKLIESAKTSELKESLNRLFKKKYEISVKEYNCLSPAVKKVVNRVITAKPGIPQLELVAK